MKVKALLRSVAAASALAAISAIASEPARAQAYPSQDIRFVCVFPAGSGADVYVRFFAEQVKKVSGKTIIVENKPGAAGLVGIEYTARAKPDGHTILVHGASGVINIPALYKNPPIDVLKDIEVVAPLLTQPWMILVDAKSPYQNMKQLTEAMLKKGDKSSYSVAATSGTIMGELYKAATGVKSIEVNYKTAGDSWNDMIAGRTDWGAHDPVASIAEARKGTMRILAISPAKRSQSLPDIPTMTEQGIPMDVTLWWAAMVPPGVPAPVKAQIAAWFAKAVASPETKTFLAQFGADPLTETIEASHERYRKGVDQWKEWVKIGKIQPQ